MIWNEIVNHITLSKNKTGKEEQSWREIFDIWETKQKIGSSKSNDSNFYI